MGSVYNNTTNGTSCDFFEGSLLYQPSFQGVVYGMYSLIFVAACLGNTFVCYIIISSSRMKTVTNYFIMNLAIGDLLVTLLAVPFTSVSMMKQFWPFGSFLCVMMNYSQALAVFVSAYTLVAISIDKYMVILWPLKPRISKRSALYVIATIWIIAGITVIPSFIFAQLEQPDEQFVKCDRYICKENFDEVGESYGTLYTGILMFLQYIIPCVVLLFTYTSIAAVIWCHRIPGEAENTRDRRIAKSKRKMIKMMLMVVLVYTICWLPFNVFMLIGETEGGEDTLYFFFTFHGLAMSHACYNPIIYCYMNPRFKDGLLQLMRKLPCFRQCILPSPNGFHNTVGIDGTESTVLQRNNTCTTYISMKRKPITRSSTSSSYQLTDRSTSLLKNPNMKRKIRYTPSIVDEQI